MHKKLAVLSALVVLAAPSFASASALTTDQVNAILSLLQSFGADQETTNNVMAALTGVAVPPPSPSCLSFTRDLGVGSTGADVTALQNYLIGKGYLAAGNATGYYGSLTSAAVGKLQHEAKIVSSPSDPGYGRFGPATRAFIDCWSATFSASPTSGRAPLAVTFTSMKGYPPGLVDATVWIEFGDGASMYVICTNASTGGVCATPANVSHTYANLGTYTAVLKSGGYCMPGTDCTQVHGSVAITVSS